MTVLRLSYEVQNVHHFVSIILYNQNYRSFRCLRTGLHRLYTLDYVVASICFYLFKGTRETMWKQHPQEGMILIPDN